MILYSLADLLWTVIGILGPLFMLVLYPAVDKLKLGSPVLVVPSISFITVFLYFYWGPHLNYSHFVLGAAAFFMLYLPSVYRWRYSSTDALALSALAILAADQMWQLPIYLDQWTVSLFQAERGLAGAGLSMMSIPLLFYFLGRGGRKIRAGELVGTMLCLAVMTTVSLLSVYWVQTYDYSAFFMWAGAFGAIVRASSPQISRAKQLSAQSPHSASAPLSGR